MNGFPQSAGYNPLGCRATPSGVSVFDGLARKLDSALTSALFSFFILYALSRAWLGKKKGFPASLKPLASCFAVAMALALYFGVGVALAASSVLTTLSGAVRLLKDGRVRLVVELRSLHLLLMAVFGLVLVLGWAPH